MSWIGGGIVIDDISEKGLSYAKAMIRSRVLDEGNCGEFPNLGNSIFPIIDFAPGVIFSSYTAAENYLEKNRNKWGRKTNVAVAFRNTIEAKNTKRMEELKNRQASELVKVDEMTKASYIKNYKSAIISCPKCNSKINKEYIPDFKCPICNVDMRSESTIKRIDVHRKNVEKIQKEIDAEVKKQERKLPVKYLVMYEEYVG